MALPVVRASVRRDLRDFDVQFDHLVRQVFGPVAASAGTAERAWRPATAVSETESAYVVELEVPGVKRDELTIEVEDGRLAVTGEVKETENGTRSSTRRTGRFEYRTRLPRGVDADGIGAELADGVLTVTIAKPETATPRRIEITQG
jgi:HSP20 family protein